MEVMKAMINGRLLCERKLGFPSLGFEPKTFNYQSELMCNVHFKSQAGGRAETQTTEPRSGTQQTATSPKLRMGGDQIELD